MEQLHSYVKSGLLGMMLTWAFLAHGQDPVFSQFNLNKNYLNPSYAGYTGDLSLGFNARRQWTNIPGEFATNTFQANIGCIPSHVGVALMGFDHTEGEGFLHTRNATAQVSVNFPGKFGRWIGRKLYHRKFIFSGGMGITAGQKTIDWSKLTFTDQYSSYEGYLGTPSLAHAYSDNSNTIIDISGGLRFQAAINRKGSYISLGMAMFHMNKPVETFFNMDNKMMPRYTAHAFIYFQTQKFVNKPDYVSVGMVTDHQQSLMTNTLLVSKDLGNHAKTSLGFRRQNFLLINRNVDAVVIQALISYGGFTIGYSYDITISDLASQRTFGTHEIGLVYSFENFALCKGGGSGRSHKKSLDDCFFLMDQINPNFRDLYLWNP